MSEPIQDPEALARWLAEQAQPIQDEPTAQADDARPCPVPVLPGRMWANAAYKAGCEDEWSDRMKSSYGGEW